MNTEPVTPASNPEAQDPAPRSLDGWLILLIVIDCVLFLFTSPSRAGLWCAAGGLFLVVCFFVFGIRLRRSGSAPKAGRLSLPVWTVAVTLVLTVIGIVTLLMRTEVELSGPAQGSYREEFTVKLPDVYEFNLSFDAAASTGGAMPYPAFTITNEAGETVAGGMMDSFGLFYGEQAASRFYPRGTYTLQLDWDAPGAQSAPEGSFSLTTGSLHLRSYASAAGLFAIVLLLAVYSVRKQRS